MTTPSGCYPAPNRGESKESVLRHTCRTGKPPSIWGSRAASTLGRPLRAAGLVRPKANFNSGADSQPKLVSCEARNYFPSLVDQSARTARQPVAGSGDCSSSSLLGGSRRGDSNVWLCDEAIRVDGACGDHRGHRHWRVLGAWGPAAQSKEQRRMALSKAPCREQSRMHQADTTTEIKCG
jgi:hypothetical protein